MAIPHRVKYTNFFRRETNAWNSRIRKLKRLGDWYWRPADPIEFVGVGASVENGDGAALTVPYPAGIVDGDFLLIFWHSRQSGRRNTLPDLWDSMVGDNTVSGTTYEFIWKQYDELTDTVEPTIESNTDATSDNPIAQMSAWRNVERLLPLDTNGTSFLYTAGATTVGPVDAPTQNFDGSAVIAAVNWRYNRTCSATAAEGDGQTWLNIGARTSVEASQGGMRWDYCITPEETNPTITDKNYTLSGDGGGGKAVMFSLTQAPRPATLNEVLVEDLATDADPIPLWKQMTTADDANEDETNWQIQRESANPSPFIPIGQVAPSTYYRSLRQDDYYLTAPYTIGDTEIDVDDIRAGCPTTGRLSINVMDYTVPIPTPTRLEYTGYVGNQFTGVTVVDAADPATYPINDRLAHLDSYAFSNQPGSYRCQLVSQSELSNRAIHHFNPGDVATTFLDVLFDETLSETGRERLDPNGTQIIQWKQTGTDGQSPMMSLVEKQSTIGFKHRPNEFSSVTLVNFDKPLPGEWMRIATRIFFHATNGSIDLYADYGYGDGFETIGQWTSIKTIPASPSDGQGRDMVNPSIGPYNPTWNHANNRRYANFQIVKNWTGAP